MIFLIKIDVSLRLGPNKLTENEIMFIVNCTGPDSLINEIFEFAKFMTSQLKGSTVRINMIEYSVVKWPYFFQQGHVCEPAAQNWTHRPPYFFKENYSTTNLLYFKAKNCIF